MRKLFLAAALAASFATFAQARDTDSRDEFFVGYSLQRADFVEGLEEDDDGITDELKSQHGFNLAATGYFTPRVGITGDFSAHFKSS